MSVPWPIRILLFRLYPSSSSSSSSLPLLLVPLLHHRHKLLLQHFNDIDIASLSICTTNTHPHTHPLHNMLGSFSKHDGNLNGDVLRNKIIVHTKQRVVIL